MSLEPPNPMKVACASRAVIELIGDKWTLLVMPALREGPKRNGALMREIEGISQKMLTQTLRRLEARGIVDRHIFDRVPPHTEYELTELGRSLGLALKSLDGWLAENWEVLHRRLPQKEARQ